METAAQPPRSTPRPPSSEKNKKVEKGKRVVVHHHHLNAFGTGLVSDPCTPRTRRWILLCLSSFLALDFVLYHALSASGTNGPAAEIVANLGALLCFPTVLVLFFVLLDLFRDPQPASAPLALPLVKEEEEEDGDDEGATIESERSLEVKVEECGGRHLKATGVGGDSLRKLAATNQWKASL